jgi:hypothetical protein
MKNFITIVTLLALSVSGLFAQAYKSRQPTPNEAIKVAGVTDYIQDGPRFNFTLYIPGQDEQYTLRETNNVVVFRSVSQLTNVVVILPNPTNSLRRGYKLVANGNLTIKLTNTVGVTYNTSTNVTALSTFTSATNSAFWVHNNNGTNWFIAPF